MLLNNLCETFNSVIKEARDKPILTQMEWMRRYIMQRNCEKRQGVLKYDKINMPYVYKYFEWAHNESRNCLCFGSIVDKWEVEYMSDRHNVDLNGRLCSCNHWQLTGIPCVHAYACILKQRGSPHDYVDAYYSKSVYQLAYEPVIAPMPGPKQWDKTDNAQPEPPPFRRLPGRPSEKKRRKESDEGKGKKRSYVKRVKRPNKCSRCGQLGHNKSTCKNPPVVVQEKDKGGRPKSDSLWAVGVREKRERRKALTQRSNSSTTTNSDIMH
ncbi:uncharacterized protein LOC141594851 [Silene latifolia]|uniref:uncharacterized protein LOC141594851 n=1 Tax=Silene latifolia TaxID=37657 RepID=UPI003D78A304